MAMLHTINKSPFERNAFEACLRLARPGASVLFIEDGIYAAVQGTSFAQKVSAAMPELSFYVLAADLKARGYDEGSLVEGVHIVDYHGFVDLVVRHERVQSWL
jgi:tRNA 2-thiouridine synthesizing protein B